jgi:uncharacterized protein (DUF433 family)
MHHVYVLVGRDIDKPFPRERPMTHDRIAMNPEVMGGKPVIRGTRIPVDMILRKLGVGMTVEEILADHPHLTTEDIRAAQAFAADYIADEELVYR